MEVCSRVTMRQGAALFLLAAAAVLGCTRAAAPRTNPEPVPEESPQDEPRLPPPPSDTVPLPTEMDIAFQNANDAEARGDYLRAVEIYENALGSAGEPVLTGIRFNLARLYLDPAWASSRVEHSRQILQTIVETSPHHARYREALALLWLIEEVAHARGQAVELKAENETLRGQVATLTADLSEKEQRLERIKQVLLQTKP